MTEDELRSLIEEDLLATRALYRQMRSEELRLLRTALTLDMEARADREFCGTRIRIIDAILTDRQHGPPAAETEG